ncbi:MAG: polyketide synthase, partial [Exilibacterium sp.]
QLDEANGLNVNNLKKNKMAQVIAESNLFETGDVDKSEDRQQDVAIIGVNGVFPKSDNLDELWEKIIGKEDFIEEVPTDHWDYRPWYDTKTDVPNKTYCKWGSFVSNVDKFDAEFFNISPKEAKWMDPQLRLLLQSVYASGEDAGYIHRLRGSDTGVFIGVCFHDYTDKIYELGLPIDPYSGTGNAQTVLANRISYNFDFNGPSLAVDTACSSSLFALHYACLALKNKECELAFVGGANLLLSSSHYRYFSSIGALSKTGRCHTFDAAADGYVPGECVGTILIKPLAQAERDNDNIYAIVKGTAALHGGYTPSLTAPSVAGEENVILKAWEKAGVEPDTITYIEAHGTGTKLGDPIEISSLNKLFNRLTDKKHFCAVGSIKANIGHTEGAAGIAGIIKVLLQLRHKTIPTLPKLKK